MRVFISAAALLVNVTHRMEAGSIPMACTRYAYRDTNIRVLPLPAPAMTRR